MHKRLSYLLILWIIPVFGYGMHISEGFLPMRWALIWWIVFLPFLYSGIRSIKKITKENARAKILLAVVGAFVFVLSSLKLPSVAGSSSHLTGVALGAILFGASGMSVIGLIVLLFQALLLAHGGLTTLGANAFSMVVCGAFVAVWSFQLLKKLALPQWFVVFMAAFLSNMIIYICTSTQLALAFQNENVSFMGNFTKFISIFAITQLPLAVVEGVFTVYAYRLIQNRSSSDLVTITPDKCESSEYV